MYDTRRKESENECQYLWRLGQAKDSGQLDIDWNGIAKLMNDEFGDPDKPYSEAAWRKPYQMSKKFFEANVFKKYSDEDSYFKELQVQKDAVYKEKRKLYDQRREYNKLLVSEARAEHLNEELVSVAKSMNVTLPLLPESTYVPINYEREAVEFWSDWHYGMVTDNIWNRYNTDICKERVSYLVDRTIAYLQMHSVDRISIVLLGDSAHGGCHVSCRVKSEEDVCDQIMHVSEIMAEAVNQISQYVNRVSVYSCYGNHLRTIQDKDQSIDSDNLEKLIPWWLRQRLKDNNKVEIIDSEYKEFVRLNVMGYRLCCVHGDIDGFKNLGLTVNTLFSRKFGETIDYTISGDKHHLEEFEQFDIESILIRSLCGTDDFANRKRLYSRPGQTLMFFNKDGRECTYHIPLDKCSK